MAARVTTRETLTARRKAILEIVERYGGRNVRLFGSIVRGEDRPDSDIDLLVTLEPGHTLLDLVAMKQDLEDLLGRRVDVVTEASISRYISDRVLKGAVPL